jgi:hypothetical protein
LALLRHDGSLPEAVKSGLQPTPSLLIISPNMEQAVNRDQVEVCLRYSVTFTPSALLSKLGISDSALQGTQPLNGLRHPSESGTSGWFIWGGEELSTDPEFFKPMHVSHLGQQCPAVVPYLGLPPGWRFLIAPNYEDVWFNADLLNIT